MIVHVTKPLFAWDELESSLTLATLRQALEAIPDGPLLAALQARRHNGCDTSPVGVLWGVLLLSILLRHPTTEACLEELRRNAPLRLLVGIESESAVPHGWNLTRFLTVLGQPEHLVLLRDVFDHMVRRLGAAVPDLGRHTAGDSTALKGRREPDDTRRAAEIADGLPQASGGRKEYQDADGKVTKVVEWFGDKLHLLVDVTHEVVVGGVRPDRHQGRGQRADRVAGRADANLPADHLETLACDERTTGRCG